MTFAFAASADCGRKLPSKPDNVFQISAGLVSSGKTEIFDVFSSRRLMLEISTPGNTKLYNVAVVRPGAPLARHYCTSAGAVGPEPVIIDVRNAPLGSPVSVWVSNVGYAHEQDISYRVFGDLSPDWKLQPSDLVRRKLYVFIFENAPLATSARAHVEAALTIWRSAGIDFEPSYRTFSGDQVVALLGEDRSLEGYLGESASEAGEWQDRERVQKLKPHGDSVAVVFAESNAGTRADPARNQAYISNDVGYPKPDLGLTVAHEIGHLLLGEGHTGNRFVPWTSGLMRAAPNTSAHISDEDAQRARNRARQLPH